jgi:DNA-binding XRE family transcriptional regulator
MNMSKFKKKTSDAIAILQRRYYKGKPARIAQLDEARAEDELARQLYELRHQAGLTQAKLAKIIGTTSSVISRMEDSNYAGHSLTMLKRIATAVDKRVQIRFIPQKRKPQPA